MGIRVDTFPALVSVTPSDVDIPLSELRSGPPSRGSHQITIARVIINDSRIIIAQDANQGPQIVYTGSIDPASYYKNPDRTKDSYVQTLSGEKIAFKRDSACGCGSRLKSWNPYGAGLMSIKDPVA